MMRRLTALLLCALSCGGGDTEEACHEGLFGQPTSSTGLDREMCSASCGCQPSWTPESLSEEALATMTRWSLVNPPSLLTDDPYLTNPSLEPQDGVCAVHLDEENTQYELASHATEEEARAQGGTVTHTGGCGQCSSLQNLAVYAHHPDLTDPVRDCGVDAVFAGLDANITCLMEIGFDEACAQIWAYNTTHTREVCLEPCLALLDAPHHNPDGSLNDCIACDEVESGPVFKAIAGRTRRNSGLPSALCRPCDSVSPVSHTLWETL